jgi:hypothetical protein
MGAMFAVLGASSANRFCGRGRHNNVIRKKIKRKIDVLEIFNIDFPCFGVVLGNSRLILAVFQTA